MQGFEFKFQADHQTEVLESGGKAMAAEDCQSTGKRTAGSGRVSRQQQKNFKNAPMGKTTFIFMKIICLDYNDLIWPITEFFERAEWDDILEEGDKKPKAIVMWNDIIDIYQELCVVAGRHGIPTFMFQHGRGAFRDYISGRMSKRNASIAFCWGEKDRQMAIKGGWTEETAIRIGSPIFAKRPKKQEEKGTVIFDAPHWDIEIPEGYLAWDKLNQIKDIKPVAKLLKGQAHDTKFYYGYSLTTDRRLSGHLETTYDLLSKASCVVTMIEGTLELMAYSLDIPVIHLEGLEKRPLLGADQPDEDYLPSRAATTATMDNLEEKVKEAIEHPELKREERREVLLEEGGDPDKDTPYQTMVSEIKRVAYEIDKAKNTGVPDGLVRSRNA